MNTVSHRSVVFFDDRYHEVYGAQENLLLLGQLVQAEGMSCRMVTSAEGALAAAARARGLPVTVVEAPPQLRTFERGTIRGGLANRYRSLRAWMRYSARLARALEASPAPDVVVAGSVRAAVHLWRLALRRGGPRILLYAQNSTPFGLFAGVAAVISDRILLIAPGAGSTFPAAVLGLLRRRVRDLPSGRDLERYAATTRAHGRDGDMVSVLTIGSITRRKGLHLLVDAVATAVHGGRRCRLVVVGGTSGRDSELYRDELVEQASRLAVELSLPGWQDDVVPFLAEADVFAMASFDEGLPGVLLEAMAAGVACLTTDAGGAGDLVEAAGCGIVVPVGDADGLAAGLTALVDDPDRRQALGRAGRRHVERHHSLAAYRRRFVAVLDEFD